MGSRFFLDYSSFHLLFFFLATSTFKVFIIFFLYRYLPKDFTCLSPLSLSGKKRFNVNLGYLVFGPWFSRSGRPTTRTVDEVMGQVLPWPSAVGKSLPKKTGLKNLLRAKALSGLCMG
jgi:hypothetical protein